MISEVIKQKIIEDYSRGETIVQVAKNNGVSESSVRRIVNNQKENEPEKEETYQSFGFELSSEQNKRLSVLAELYNMEESELLDAILKSLRDLYDHKLSIDINDFITTVLNGVSLATILTKRKIGLTDLLEQLEEIDDNGIEIHELKRAVNLVHKLRNFDGVINQMDVEIHEKEAEKTELDKQIEDFEAHISNKQRILNELVNSINSKKIKLQELIEECKNYEAKSEKLTNGILVAAKKRSEIENKSLQQEINKRKEDIEKLNSVLTEMVSRIDSLKPILSFHERLEKGDKQTQLEFLKSCAASFNSENHHEKQLVELIYRCIENKLSDEPTLIF